ncbi:MAG: hypothetical protein EOO65_01360 [Methanosarcinales archaeon]|nr:MAG: hypothetical protein EOO65_01360 [Methanosarcinales archaeon]
MGVVAVVAAIVLGVILGRRQSDKTADDGCSYTDYMLRPYASPSRYNVYWKPQFTAPFQFEGRTDIDVSITADGIQCVQLHALGLNFSAITVDAGNGPQAVQSWRSDTVNERVVVPLPSAYNTGM